LKRRNWGEEIKMSDLETLSAKKLHTVISARNARWDEVLTHMIQAGLGHATFVQIVEISKGSSLLSRTVLARDYLNASHDWKVAMDELDRRRAYHGSDRPIKITK
jgi:hypothetical protein